MDLEAQENKLKKSDIEPMLTLQDVMENLHIESKTTALKLFALDNFPSIKIGKKYLVPLSAYNKWIKSITGTEITL